MNKNRELIAILRGLTRDRSVVVSEILIAEGFSKLEVPLNSPNPVSYTHLTLPTNVAV